MEDPSVHPLIRVLVEKTSFLPNDNYHIPNEINLPIFEIIFPKEISGNARIRFNGYRIIDWEDGRWVSYEKEGVQWYKVNLDNLDYKILYHILRDKIKKTLFDLLKD